MAYCTVTLSANAGVSLQLGSHQIWVDALHDQKVEGFSTVSPDLWEQMRRDPAFSAPDHICFTHCHADHYSRKMAAQAKMLWPHAALALPVQDFSDQLLLLGHAVRVSSGSLGLRFLRLVHDGAIYADTPHYGLIVSHGDFRVLLPGDCSVADPVVEEALGGEGVDVAVLNFLWIMRREGRDFVRSVIRPRHLLLHHLPFAQDEVFRYRPVTQRCVNFLDLPDVRILSEPLQREIICQQPRS